MFFRQKGSWHREWTDGADEHVAIIISRVSNDEPKAKGSLTAACPD